MCCLVCDARSEIDQCIPRNLLSPANRARIADQVLAAYSEQRDKSRRQCKLAYLRVCKSLHFYGAAFFAVQNTRNPRFPSELVLAVTYKGLSMVSVENEAALAQYRYVDIASWGYSSNSFVFVVAQADEDDTEHVLKTSAVCCLFLSFQPLLLCFSEMSTSSCFGGANANSLAF